MRQKGYHLFGTITNCNEDKLVERHLLYKLLSDMPEAVGMNKIPANDNPRLYECNHPSKPNSSGYSGNVILWESHFAIHTWPHYREVDFDLFSCKWFNGEEVLRLMEVFFDGDPTMVMFVNRDNGRIEFSMNAKIETRTVSEVLSDTAD